MGLLVLFAIAAAIIIAIGTLWLIRLIRQPPRRSVGAALARGYPTEPADLKLKGEQVTFRLNDDTTTAGWIIEGEVPAGPVVILTHGWASSRFNSLVKSPWLARFASKVVAYDLRAHGDSTAKRSHLGPTEANDLLAIIDQSLTERDASRPVVLYGSSMGAVISMAAAVREVEGNGEARRIVGVIAEAPYVGLHTPLLGQMRRREIPRFPFAALAMAHFRFWIRDFGPFDRTPHAAKLTTPLLILHGDADRISPHSHGQEIARQAPAAELVTFPGAGHSRLHEHDPDAYHAALARFFERVSPSEPPNSSNV